MSRAACPPACSCASDEGRAPSVTSDTSLMRPIKYEHCTLRPGKYSGGKYCTLRPGKSSVACVVATKSAASPWSAVVACPAGPSGRSRRPGGKRPLRPPAHLLMSSSADVAPTTSCDGWGPNRRCSTWCGMHKWMGFCYMCARPNVCLLVGLACTGPCWSQVFGFWHLLRALCERLPRPSLCQRHVLDPFAKFTLLNLLCQLDILTLLVGSNILDLLVWRIHDARLLGRNLPNLLVAFGCNASADYSS